MEISQVSLNNQLNSISSIKDINMFKNVEESNESFIPFVDIFKDAVNNVIETDSAVQEDILKIATGDADAMHQLTINMAKADLATYTLVQVRNKALEAYNEIMRISL